MKVFITSGTIDFLKKLKAKHPGIKLMSEQDGGIAYFEGEKNIFQTGRTYEVVDASADLKETGFVVMNNIPVTDEGRPIFEDRFKNRAGAIEDTPGFQAIRILRPTQGNTYIVFTQWQDEASFEAWKESQAFKHAHKNSGPQNKEKPPFIAGESYLTKCYMIEDEE